MKYIIAFASSTLLVLTASHHGLAFQTPLAPMSAADFTSLTRMVQDESVDRQALRSSLLNEGQIMTSRLQEISESVLPELISSREETNHINTDFFMQPSHHPIAIPFGGHKDVMTVQDYTTMIHKTVDAKGNDELTRSLINQFQQERAICTRRMAMVDEALCRMDHLENGDDYDEMECLLHVMQHVWTMERESTPQATGLNPAFFNV